jgi:AcrR family transcriptional regulator
MTPRAYESATRAEAARATRERIVRAAVDLAYARGDIEMTLDEIAERAGTTVRTVLRQFGSRDAVIEAGIELGAREVAEERVDAGGDRQRSIHLLVEHYEKRGAFVLRILASDLPGALRVAATGRLVHRAWVQEVFATDDEELTDLLVVATDVYAWKLLRLDRGLSATQTEGRIRVLTERLVAR